MKAIILAAGRGSRMGTATDNKPKCLTNFHGKTLLNWQLSAINASGIEEIGIVCGYQRGCLPDSLTKFINQNWQHSNMVSSLLCAKEWLRNEHCLISYSDIVYGSKVVKELIAPFHDDDIKIAYDENWLSLWQKRYQDPREDAETFNQKDGVLTEIGEKISDINAVSGQYMGLLKTSPTSWQIIERYLSNLSQMEVDQLDMTTLIRNLMLQKTTIRTISNTQSWYEIDNLNDLKVCQELPHVEI